MTDANGETAVAGPPSPARRKAALALLLACVFSPGVPPPAIGSHPVGWALQTIDVDRLKQLLDSGRAPVLVDVRSAAQHREGHIPGARSLSLDESGDRFRELPRDRAVVLYCSCPMAEVGSAYQFLRYSGFRDVLVLEGGFTAWQDRGYPIGTAVPR